MMAPLPVVSSGPERMSMASNGPVEPDAEARIGAANLRQIFLALVAEDFTEQQALIIVGHMIVAARFGE